MYVYFESYHFRVASNTDVCVDVYCIYASFPVVEISTVFRFSSCHWKCIHPAHRTRPPKTTLQFRSKWNPSPWLDQLHVVRLGGNSGPEGPAPHSRFSVLHPAPAQPRSQLDGARFLGQQLIRPRQIMLEFYPSVPKKTSQFMSHDWELVVCMVRPGERQ
jgi:hypothetical protein